ncbi:MAG: hypothetical protein ABSA97_14150 [Verrucomicrobiia bacterium]
MAVIIRQIAFEHDGGGRGRATITLIGPADELRAALPRPGVIHSTGFPHPMQIMPGAEVKNAPLALPPHPLPKDLLSQLQKLDGDHRKNRIRDLVKHFVGPILQTRPSPFAIGVDGDIMTTAALTK